MMPPPSQTAEPLNGKVVDARNHKPVAYPVISVIWTLKFKGDIAAEGQSMPLPEGQSALTKVEQDYGNSAGEFHVQGLSPFGFDWKVIPGQVAGREGLPLVRIYAKGYKRLVIENVAGDHAKLKRPYNPTGATMLKWVGQNQTQMLQPWPVKPSARVKELRLWKKDLDDGINAARAMVGQKRAIESQERLLLVFNEMCQTLPQPARKNSCYAPDSEIGRYITQFADERARNYLVITGADGERPAVPVQLAPDAPTSEMLNQSVDLIAPRADGGESP